MGINQRNNLIEKVVFKYLNKHNYIQLDINDKIYFMENKGDEYAVIRYNKDIGWCIISKELVSFLSKFTSTDVSIIESVIGIWVEDTLNMNIIKIWSLEMSPFILLKITHN
jgi:hypothetical protein